MTRDLGDFQTPASLVSDIVNLLDPVGRKWLRVLEPTCGSGGFIKGLLSSSSPPQEICGFELQPEHFNEARRLAATPIASRVIIQRANIFDIDFGRDIEWKTDGPLLVIGNPPWVTNSALGAMGSANLPRKSNLKKLNGLDALTGNSNFDLAEYILLKLLRELACENPTLVMLCKTSVARNVLQFAYDNSMPLTRAWLRRIDAKKHFNAAVDACLFYLEMRNSKPQYEAAIFSDLHSRQPESILGFASGRMVKDLRSYDKAAFVEGRCPLVWRQGVKHDAATVLELKREGNRLLNRLGEEVAVENRYIYPLIKSRDLLHSTELRLWVIIAQRRVGDDTEKLKREAPRLWRYLESHAALFARRKSSIYQGRPLFSIFGVGDYSFSPFKVGVSGFHKSPRFHLIAPVESRPVMLDDTCYFLSCRNARQSALITALLNHRSTLAFLGSTMFVDSKRPVTKKLLQRIDLSKLIRCLDRSEIITAAEAELSRLSLNDISSKRWPDELSSLLNDFK
ncbi:MAG TPA: class I SAM-dependent methyltransferase [Blastocatellia bacterium]|jgi:hypothetical protein